MIGSSTLQGWWRGCCALIIPTEGTGRGEVVLREGVRLACIPTTATTPRDARRWKSKAAGSVCAVRNGCLASRKAVRLLILLGSRRRLHGSVDGREENLYQARQQNRNEMITCMAYSTCKLTSRSSSSISVRASGSTEGPLSQQMSGPG